MYAKVILISLFLLFTSTQSTLIDEFLANLPESKEEVEQVIIKDFLTEYHRAQDLNELMK